MNSFLWILQILLAAFFILPGYGKLFSSKAQHIKDQHIKEGQSVIPIRILGVLEWLGCIGIVAPWWFGILRILTPLSALGFSMIMLSGMVVHIRKREFKMLPMLGIVFLCCILVASFRLKSLL